MGPGKGRCAQLQVCAEAAGCPRLGVFSIELDRAEIPVLGFCVFTREIRTGGMGATGALLSAEMGPDPPALEVGGR